MTNRYTDSSYSTTGKPGKKWVAPLILGALLPCALWYGYRRVNPPVNPSYVAAAKQGGYDARTYSNAMDLLGKACHKDLSDSDWKQLMTIYNDKNSQQTEIKMAVISCMMQMGKSSHRQEILTLVRPNLTGKDTNLEASTLSLIWHFHEPDCRQQALDRRGRTEPEIKMTVEAILARSSY